MARPSGPADRAFVLRTAPYGEADLIVTMFTEREGVVPAIAKRARASTPKRRLFLEPFHTLAVELTSGRGELSSLRSAIIDVARPHLLDSASHLDAGGMACRWIRALSPPRVAEPEVFAALEELLDGLERETAPTTTEAITRATTTEGRLVVFGLELLDVLGYGLAFDACARCSKPRPSGKPAFVSAEGGGVVCEACRPGVPSDNRPLPGAVLDQLQHRANAATLSIEHAAQLLAVVRDAIDRRARAIGSKKGVR